MCIRDSSTTAASPYASSSAQQLVCTRVLWTLDIPHSPRCGSSARSCAQPPSGATEWRRLKHNRSETWPAPRLARINQKKSKR
eukprot:5677081-Pleurochrysis_carterae.AAC.1